MLRPLNSIPNDRFLAFADAKMHVKKQKCGKEWLENIAGKEENAGFQHFLLFPRCFLPQDR